MASTTSSSFSYVFPNYYAILNVDEEATQNEIQTAYQQQAILYHPDNRNSIASSEDERQQRFQQLADAYYILRNEERRCAYDKARKRGEHSSRWQNAHTDPEEAFANAYDELMRPAVERPGFIWRVLGGGSGAALGFIIANTPGALVGVALGSQLGRVRDMKKKSVYSVFKELDDHHRQAIIDSVLNKLQLI
ncbi:DnaJ chaperone [Syncephalis fuscata]|nr:DnaJ chaperone [Syncephalis fuscata]